MAIGAVLNQKQQESIDKYKMMNNRSIQYLCEQQQRRLLENDVSMADEEQLEKIKEQPVELIEATFSDEDEKPGLQELEFYKMQSENKLEEFKNQMQEQVKDRTENVNKDYVRQFGSVNWFVYFR